MMKSGLGSWGPGRIWLQVEHWTCLLRKCSPVILSAWPQSHQLPGHSTTHLQLSSARAPCPQGHMPVSHSFSEFVLSYHFLKDPPFPPFNKMSTHHPPHTLLCSVLHPLHGPPYVTGIIDSVHCSVSVLPHGNRSSKTLASLLCSLMDLK